MKRLLKSYQWESTLVVLLVIAVIVGSSISPFFLDATNLAHSAATFVPVALMALGLFPIVVTGEIDISLPSILAVSAVTLAQLSAHGVPFVAGLLISAVLCMLLGAINGLLVAVAGLPSMAVTLGAMGVYRGLAYFIGGDAGVTSIDASYAALGSTWVWWIPVPLIVFAIAAVLLWITMARSAFGSYLYAIGNGADAVRTAGISVRAAKVKSYVIGAVGAWLAGLIWIGEYMSARGDNADGTLMLVLTCVVLGGVSIFGGSGKTSGVILSCALLYVLQTAMSLANVPGTTQTLMQGAVLLAAVIISNGTDLLRMVKFQQLRHA